MSSGLSGSPFFCWGLCKRFRFSLNEIDVAQNQAPKTTGSFLSVPPFPAMEATRHSGGEEMHFSEKQKDSPRKGDTGTLDPQKWENLRPDEVLVGIIKVNS